MKKTVCVTITKEIEIDIPDDMLTEEAVKEFSSTVFKVRDNDELFHYAASYVARNDDSFVEGLGTIKYKETYEDVHTEITFDSLKDGDYI